jgi:hypothetical protein
MLGCALKTGPKRRLGCLAFPSGMSEEPKDELNPLEHGESQGQQKCAHLTINAIHKEEKDVHMSSIIRQVGTSLYTAFVSSLTDDQKRPLPPLHGQSHGYITHGTGATLHLFWYRRVSFWRRVLEGHEFQSRY